MESVAPSTPAAPAAPPESFSSVDAAARFLVERRERGDAPAAEIESEPIEDAETGAEGETELSGEDNAAPDENQATGETEATDPADDLPPLEMPRSWTKAQAEHWKALPRATQEYLSEQASQASAEVRRLQNEAAEARKAVEAKGADADKARTDYETKARAALDILAREQQRDYADIKTAQDVVNLSRTDPLRYIQWQAHQTELAAIKETVDAADKRKADEAKTKRSTYQAEQRTKLVELVPELADQKKYTAAWERAMPELAKLGLSTDALDRLASTPDGSEILFSAAFQKLIVDSQRLADMQKAKAAQVTKAVPAVQRPGVKPVTNANSERVQALTQRFHNSGSLKDAAALLASRRSQVRRSA